MLETVKQTINNLPCISFSRYYSEYVMDIQDQIIENEISNVRRSLLNPVMLNYIVDKEFRGLEYDK